jgi:hypothetical protein
MLNWDEAPPWARYAAPDEVGNWFWFEERPVTLLGEGIWTSSNGRIEEVRMPNVDGWAESLQERPDD